MILQLLRYSLFIGFAILWGAFAAAQDWAPVDESKTYYYQADTATHVTHQIQVDSLATVNGKDIMFLNKVLRECDTCDPRHLPTFPNDEDTIYYHVDHPPFLQGKVIDTNGQYHFHNPHHFVLEPKTPVDTPWNFRPDSNVTARIDEIFTRNVFGQTDSVKRILLSNNDTILLSKAHGILQFPGIDDNLTFALKGIKDTSSKGEAIPGFYEMFDFNVGDVFQYKIYKFIEPHPLTTRDIWKRVKITDKSKNGDTLKYQTKSRSLEVYQYGNQKLRSHSSGQNVLKYVASPDHRSNCYPGEVIKASSFQNSFSYYGDSLATNCGFTVDSNQRMTKTIGNKVETNKYGNTYFYGGYYQRVKQNIFQKLERTEFTFSKQFKEGLGLTHQKEQYFEHDYEKQLIGYVKGGDTTGKVLSDQQLTASIQKAEQSNVSLFPNPVQKVLHIEGISGKNAKVTLFDRLGRKISEKTNDSPKLIFDMSSFESGIYFIMIQKEGGLVKRKVVKQ